MPRRAAVAALAAALALPSSASAQQADADSLFARGQLDAAGAAYAQRRAQSPTDVTALKRLGLVSLWKNDLTGAEVMLREAQRLDGNDPEIPQALAETYYRQGRYAEAAPLLRSIGEAGKGAKLRAIGSAHMAAVPGGGSTVRFVGESVLPVLEVSVNGETVHMLLDTGGGETIIDPALADRIHAPRYGSDSGAFAGGRVGTFEHGTVDSIALGRAVVRGVPVVIQSTRAYAGAAGGVQVDGIIGTTLLSRFRTTIDFRNRVLLLFPRGTPPPSGIEIPFWLIGDHFITVQGSAGGRPALFVFDSGLALPGGAFVPAASLLSELGVNPSGQTVTGIGGGGTVTVTPFRFAPALEIGPLSRSGVVAVAGAFPAQIERRYGVRLAGLVSHGYFAGQRVTLDFDGMVLIVEGAQADAGGPATLASGADAPTANAAGSGAAGGGAAAAGGASVSADSLVALSRTIVALLRDKKYDALKSYWSPRTLERLPPEKLGGAWEGVVSSIGPVASVGEPQLVAGQRQMKVPVRFGTVPIDVTLSFDEAGLVTGVAMQGGD